MGKAIKTSNYYEILRDLEDSYFPCSSYTFIEDYETLIYYDVMHGNLYIKSLTSCEDDFFNELYNLFFANNIHFKNLSDMSESNLFSENYNIETDYSKGFYVIVGMMLVYYELLSNNWYSEDLNDYNIDSITNMLGFFTDHNIGFLETT